MFHGTQDVHNQIVKYFLGYKKVVAFGRKCMSDAPDHVSLMFSNLTNKQFKVKSSCSMGDGATALGVPSQYQKNCT